MSKKVKEKNYMHKGGFVALPRRVFNSRQFKALPAVSRCILMEMKELYRPYLNGRLVYSQKQAMRDIGINHDRTIAKYFLILLKRGFIELSMEGDHTKGKAREWRLTFESCNGHEPTDEWMLYDPDNDNIEN